MDIITSHLNADFDSLACMIAAKKLYPDASIVFPGSQERKVRDFIEVFTPLTITRIRDLDPAKVTRLIIVDTKQPDRLGPLAELLARKNIEIHVFDHHPFSEGDIRGSCEKADMVGATSTILTEMLREKKLHPTPMEATILALGIYEETGCLLFPSTTERDLLAVSYLIRRGANLNIVADYVKLDLRREELELLSELLDSSQELTIKGIRIILAKASRDSYVGDAAILAHKIMDMEDIDAAIIILSMEGKTVLVARSRVQELDVSLLLREFGGGGHPAAAAATVKADSPDMIADRIARMLPVHVRPGKVAADIMTQPVITISWDSPIAEAEDILTKYGVNVLPVIRDGAYKGLISRETVEKALFHGFRKNHVIDFCSTDKLTVTADTPIRDIETMMIEQNQRFMPVLEGDRVIGAITRTDLLRILYEEFLRKRRLDKGETIEPHFSSRNLSGWLRDKFPENVYAVLKLSGEIAERLGYGAYLVGGSVRDLLRGEQNLDIDIVIEGDGIAFAHALSQQIPAKVKSHLAFGTAQVFLETLRMDVATARTEYYESPAALPKVETSSIKKDLYRRDFTINSLAIRLNPQDFGLLMDFFGGQRDIKEKTIRVLHNLSFVEDPTRAFRAIRFSERFGFRLSRHTETLMKSALEMGLFDRLSGSRLYDELLLAFHETNPVLTLQRLSDYGLLKVIHPAISFDEDLERSLAGMSETLAWYDLLFLDGKVDKGILYLMALLSLLNEPERSEALVRLDVPARTRELIQNSISGSAAILAKLPAKDPVALYHLLENRETEAVLFAVSAARDVRKKKDISHFLVELRKVKPILRGNDLKMLGVPQGPLYSRILNELRDARLMGKVATREDEAAFVKKRYPAGPVTS
ncbi:MAG: CBS domain-containing protein [Nitrospirae bacterium]|nr:CBS domain-containing protein [Nitrospirota bacterium]